MNVACEQSDNGLQRAALRADAEAWSDAERQLATKANPAITRNST